jgi:hypothetical protein
MNAEPFQHFAIPPCPAKGPTYRAVQYSPISGWAGVESGSNSMNVLSFPDKPGVKFTTLAHAQEIAKEWNKQ